jgi:tRNA threonylcarbamoyladenosine biosynthesis protein TsaB
LLDQISTQSIELDPRWGSAKTLAPAIEKLLMDQGLTTGDLQAIAVIQGPGSFTGLRVGIATAKVMAYALRIPVIALDTMDVIARDFFRSHREHSRPIDLFVVVDAFRGQSFWGRYQLRNQQLIQTVPTKIDDNEALADEIQRQTQDSDTFVVGPSLQKLKESLKQPQGTWLGYQPQASVVAELGWQAWIRGETSDIFGLLPTYYRSSAAEEKQVRVSK